MRRWLIALVLVLAVALGAAGYVHQPAPRSALGDAVGVRRSRPFNDSCGWFVRDTRLATFPTGKAVCAWYRPPSAERVAELDQLEYHILTRRVSHAARKWEPLSEQAWRRDLDSVRTALRAQGGALSCARRSERTDAEIREYWRFPAFEILLFSGRDTLPFGDSGHAAPRWFLFLRDVRRHSPECPTLSLLNATTVNAKTVSS